VKSIIKSPFVAPTSISRVDDKVHGIAARLVYEHSALIAAKRSLEHYNHIIIQSRSNK